MIFETILLIGLLASGVVILINTFFSSKQKNIFRKKPAPIEFIKGIFPILLIVFCLRSFAFEAFRIPSSSMQPTLVEGDLILVDKFSHGLRIPLLGSRITNMGNPKRGDIVVFRGNINGKKSGIIKRIVGMPGDHIKYHNKILYINGNAAAQNFISKDTSSDQQGNTIPVIRKQENLGETKHDIYLYPSILNNNYPYKDLVVPKGSYFVMGDSRDNSVDSRYWGVIQDNDIVGKARYIWMSVNWKNLTLSKLNKLKELIRWSRLGKLT